MQVKRAQSDSAVRRPTRSVACIPHDNRVAQVACLHSAASDWQNLIYAHVTDHAERILSEFVCKLHVSVLSTSMQIEPDQQWKIDISVVRFVF